MWNRIIIPDISRYIVYRNKNKWRIILIYSCLLYVWTSKQPIYLTKTAFTVSLFYYFLYIISNVSYRYYTVTVVTDDENNIMTINYLRLWLTEYKRKYSIPCIYIIICRGVKGGLSNIFFIYCLDGRTSSQPTWY